MARIFIWRFSFGDLHAKRIPPRGVYSPGRKECGHCRYLREGHDAMRLLFSPYTDFTAVTMDLVAIRGLGFVGIVDLGVLSIAVLIHPRLVAGHVS
jgi:hypothetical protein